MYGIAWHKVHAKALLIVRRESGRIRRYVHLGTGNYRDDTARLYTDVGLLTADDELAMEGRPVLQRDHRLLHGPEPAPA